MSLLFFTLTPITLGISLYSLFSLKVSAVQTQKTENNIVTTPVSGLSVYASLPTLLPSVSASIGVSDARPEMIRQYMDYYNSPLSPYADLIVKTADKYGIDYRLIVAISQQESNICKIIPPGSYNCWGWGITGTDSLGFDSFEQGIDTVSKGLRENYLDKGYTTIEQIMSKYTPLSNGSWANGVSSYMGLMQ
ncbi:MAG TPA: hypothetical protein VKC54_00770 [Patescibacteria group bacterium]|nr:hypothetical protein [Patescibacteria group bacterium]